MKNIVVENLSSNLIADELHALFQSDDPVKRVEIVTAKPVADLNGTTVRGNPLKVKVEEARPKLQQLQRSKSASIWGDCS